MVLVKKALLGVTSVAYSPDGKRLASGIFDSTIMVWDTGTGQEILTLKGHVEPVTSVAYSPDGKRILSGGGNVFDPDRAGEIKMWDAERGQDVLTLAGHKDIVKCTAFSPDGKRFVSASRDGTAQVWDAETYRPLLTFRGHTNEVRQAAYSPDGKRIVSGSDMTVRVWDAGTGDESAHVPWTRGRCLECGLEPGRQTDRQRQLGPDRESVGRRHRSGHCHIGGSPANGEQRGLEPRRQTHPQRFRQPVPARPGRRGKALGRRQRTGSCALTGHTDRVFSVAFSFDGKCAFAGCGAGNVTVWSAATGDKLFALEGHSLPVNSVTTSSDGKRLLTGAGDHLNSGKPGEIKVWDADNGQQLLSLMGHTQGVSSVALSPDGTRILSGDWANMVKIWEAGRQRATPDVKISSAPPVANR